MLAALRAPLARPLVARVPLARTYAMWGGAPNTGKWETSTDPSATESEANVRADDPSIPNKPDAAMQEATANEAEAEYRAEQPITHKVKEAKRTVEGAVKNVTDKLTK